MPCSKLALESCLHMYVSTLGNEGRVIFNDEILCIDALVRKSAGLSKYVMASRQ